MPVEICYDIGWNPSVHYASSFHSQPSNLNQGYKGVERDADARALPAAGRPHESPGQTRSIYHAWKVCTRLKYPEAGLYATWVLERIWNRIRVQAQDLASLAVESL